MAFKIVLTCNCIAGHLAGWFALLFNLQTTRTQGDQRLLFLPLSANTVLHKQFLSGASWRRAGRSRWGPRYGGSKSFGFPGLRGRKPESFGYRYGGDLDSLARSHTLAAQELLVN